MMAIITRLEKLTPRKAADALEHKATNRPISEGYSRRIAAAIKAGEWRINGETLKYDTSGNLQDGQHRCMAVMIADTAIETFVTRGLDPNVFDTIDLGRRRALSDMLARNCEMNYTKLAGAIGWIWRFANGTVQNGRGDSPRIQEGLKVLEDHPRLRDSVAMAIHNRSKLYPPSIAGAIHYLTSQKGNNDADRFFHHLLTGENIAKTSPETSGIFWLRSRLEDNLTEKAKLPAQEIIALTIKSWNAFRDRQVVKALRWSLAEEFPSIK